IVVLGVMALGLTILAGEFANADGTRANDLVIPPLDGTNDNDAPPPPTDPPTRRAANSADRADRADRANRANRADRADRVSNGSKADACWPASGKTTLTVWMSTTMDSSCRSTRWPSSTG
ncbi:MAG: hypothetical protein J5I93_01865, partial [Pirellulaceae bacterium]|nr:hypothetical protein [Pirellulaceae bacterium]